MAECDIINRCIVVDCGNNKKNVQDVMNLIELAGEVDYVVRSPTEESPLLVVKYVKLESVQTALLFDKGVIESNFVKIRRATYDDISEKKTTNSNVFDDEKEGELVEKNGSGFTTGCVNLALQYVSFVDSVADNGISFFKKLVSKPPIVKKKTDENKSPNPSEKHTSEFKKKKSSKTKTQETQPLLGTPL
ncbi:hypothetical protein EIN_315520 [Entamoeba invadens IP1]|uniref:RRM domain-containing protein n=1 Tax=Entamoeba invadens IP1 TaxID=370355 RepID=A0A0A1U2P7_ENTIV|nr:hypothetical protein EIN_315520 [Entamoeba invadens IP1]ELP86933.1 hypothetical protein EIN_315520 [Entamoeba invadens IP1]|eukprot:XP_004253704.1 hypothetical protein EIN_315520 [Entamoeba invadens IP1]